MVWVQLQLHFTDIGKRFPKNGNFEYSENLEYSENSARAVLKIKKPGPKLTGPKCGKYYHIFVSYIGFNFLQVRRILYSISQSASAVCSSIKFSSKKYCATISAVYLAALRFVK